MTSDIPVPGTVQLVDLDGVLHAKHSKGKDIVLIPQPTDHPDDPLAWTPRRKAFNIFWAMTWCFLAAAIISGLSPAYLMIAEDTGISVADLSTGNGLMYLFLGWGTLITQNLALNLGRRLTLVASILLTTFVTLWSAYVHTRAEFFVNRILLGIVSSPMETLIEVIIGDVFFTHQRGLYMGIYSWTLWNGAFLCPVVSGFVAEAHGWRWIQYILSIIGGALTVVTFLFFEETMFHRAVQPFGALDVTIPFAEDPSALEADAQNQSEMAEPKAVSAQHVDSVSGERRTAIPSQPKTFVQKLALWGYQEQRPPLQVANLFLPFLLLSRFPLVIFSGFLVGGILSWYNVVGGSLALILGNAPYNFGTNTIGLFYLAAVIGVSIGCFLCSALTDKLAVWFARRSNGVMEPEQRLWLCIVCLLCHPAGCLLYGIGAASHIHWVGIAFGLLLISITLPIGSALAFNYILDSYKEVAGEGLVSSILIRNLMGFAFSYAVVPMIDDLGLQDAFILIACLGFAVWCMCIIMIIFGKSVRRASAKTYWDLIERRGFVSH
ncbi:major facilitator superfamily protein [Purpureocillium lilacinum]|uniref:Major facilitator superfamily protein n=1 Tax=Purpureocillium lilacinum TaxID=33203 RepID=A0A179GX27_PURLI|nr:hypothetical protein Purlil1_7825 [Purpureocillium lilacinum]OAQ82048.1 major facilitator superfamily protein [Purpureocillium lilacinum]GJN73400.1 hypothetical protein PLICBS_007478 [Purpureocillium lilacinum]